MIQTIQKGMQSFPDHPLCLHTAKMLVQSYIFIIENANNRKGFTVETEKTDSPQSS